MPIAKARANPTKAFFVRMLTRDISLEDCILDLVDNSIDAAWKSSGDIPSGLVESTSLASYNIDLRISSTSFSITDDCGGITLDDAIEYAFTFGRIDDFETEDMSEADADAAADNESDEAEFSAWSDSGGGREHHEESTPFSVGVYGIGMKRSIFKIGRSIKIRSTYRTDNNTTSFVVPIDVPTWLGRNPNDPWDFDIEADEPDSSVPGVAIEVNDLTPATSEKFGDPGFLPGLRRTLGRDYMLPLMRGLNLSINGDPVTTWTPIFRSGAEFAPMRDSYFDDNVAVEILAGMTSAPPDDSAPDDSGRRDTTSGWYVVCNGRVIMAADRSSQTVWEVGLPQWHSQYSGFLGIVFFTSSDSRRLPMTTTKRNVDQSSKLYRRAVVRMRTPTRAWIDYTNERKTNLPEAHTMEEQATGLRLTLVAPRPAVGLPTMGRKGPRTTSIQYSVPLERIRQLGEAFDDVNMSAREVGRQAFEYAYKQLVPKDQ